ncbi:MAG: helix-turn-helix domain-containing protein [Candidatus Aenigmarchaeota archaeon]|nr:helix-turn-helix domain-containing protein [Candidatus Aenigmarchaeota archaeon]
MTEDIKKRIIKVLKKYEDGLTISEIAKLLGVHRHTITKYVYELTGSKKIRQRRVGPAKLCYFKRSKTKSKSQLSVFLFLPLIPALILAQTTNFTNSFMENSIDTLIQTQILNISQVNEIDIINESSITDSIPNETCEELWNCVEWSSCIDGQQTRTCVDLNLCGTTLDKPSETQLCIECNLTCDVCEELDPVNCTCNPITSCILGDGCCPDNCNYTADPDCVPECLANEDCDKTSLSKYVLILVFLSQNIPKGF